MRAPTQFVIGTLAVACACLLTVAAVNAWVDPFMQYHPPGAHPRFVTGFARHINAGLMRNTGYDAVLVGSSYAMNFRNSDFDRAFGGHTVSLTMPGMFVSEGAKVVRHALRYRDVRRVYFGLDFFAFVDADNRYDFPDYLYDERWWNDTPYLLSLDTLKRSAYAWSGRGPAYYNTDPDTPWSWAREGAHLGRDRVIADFNSKRAAPGSARPKYNARDMEDVARRELVPLLAAHPKTEFHFFLPPYSKLSWALDEQAGDIATLLAFRSRLSTMLAAYPNAHLHDFQAWTARVCDLDRYVDVGHYGPDVNREMVALMREREFEATPTAVATNNARIARLATDCGPQKPTK